MLFPLLLLLLLLLVLMVVYSLLGAQASVTFFPVQGLENNVAYWTSIGVAEASRLPGAA